jgi:hypothetical protein
MLSFGPRTHTFVETMREEEGQRGFTGSTSRVRVLSRQYEAKQSKYLIILMIDSIQCLVDDDLQYVDALDPELNRARRKSFDWQRTFR